MDSEQIEGMVSDLDSGMTYIKLALEELCDTLKESIEDEEVKKKIEMHKMAIIHAY